MSLDDFKLLIKLLFPTEALTSYHLLPACDEKKPIYVFDCGDISFIYKEGNDYVVARGRLEEKEEDNKKIRVPGFYHGIKSDLYGIYPQEHKKSATETEIEYIIYTRAGFIWSLLASEATIDSHQESVRMNMEEKFRIANGKVIEANVNAAIDNNYVSLQKRSGSSNPELKESLDLLGANVIAYSRQNLGNIDYESYPFTLHIGFSQKKDKDTAELQSSTFEIIDLATKNAMRYTWGKNEVRYSSEYSYDEGVNRVEHVIVDDNAKGKKEYIIVERINKKDEKTDKLVYDVLSRKIVESPNQDGLSVSVEDSDLNKIEMHILGLLQSHIRSTGKIVSQYPDFSEEDYPNKKSR